MKFLSLLAAGLAVFVTSPTLAAPAGEAPTLKAIEAYDGETTGKYIVKFKSGASRRAWAEKLSLSTEHSWDSINGFSGSFDEAALLALRASDDVEYVAEDGVMHAWATTTQTNAPWGLSRVAQKAKLASSSTTALTYQYTYDTTAGAGVDIYQFGGRATWGVSYVGESSDGNGHGTHCAGTAAGGQFGVAKKANIIAVQVLGRTGEGTNAGTVSGLNWVLSRARSTGRPSVVSMSLGGPASTAVDDAVASLTGAGVHVVVAAGNENQDAGSSSPARAASAITVGATTIADARASYSNYGRVIDIWAPGSNVISSWIGSDTATNSISGTSMATPHVAGVVAYLIGKDGNVTPAAMATKLNNLSLSGAITGIPKSCLTAIPRL
ncbi:serine protease [Coprinopsis sp. MPI-PUGE-AT-0042]|nr:serine protease [Coprinopsis sp. MPI-PUGE-AT-0042]